MFLRQARRLRTVADEKVATVRGRNDFKTLRPGRPDDDDLVDTGVGLKGVRRADCGVAGDEQTDSHLGWTGFQSSAGSDTSLLRRNAKTAAAASTMTTSGEKRLTIAVYDDPSCCGHRQRQRSQHLRFSIRRVTRDDW